MKVQSILTMFMFIFAANLQADKSQVETEKENDNSADHLLIHMQYRRIDSHFLESKYKQYVTAQVKLRQFLIDRGTNETVQQNCENSILEENKINIGTRFNERLYANGHQLVARHQIDADEAWTSR